MERCLSGCVGLNEACKVLVKSRTVQSLVKKSVGAARFKESLILMKAGNLGGDLGANIHDLLTDTISSEAKAVWSGLIRQSHDDYPVSVKEFHGVYSVWAMEYDEVGYLLDKDVALSFVRSEWDSVYEEGEEPDEDSVDTDDEGEIRCPYCDTTDGCDHLLLRLDVTFREGLDGLLFDAFNSRWADILNEASNEDEDRDSDEDSDFNEGDSFDELLDEVRSISDVELTSSPESAPGMSSNFGYYFCSSKKKAVEALKKFSKP